MAFTRRIRPEWPLVCGSILFWLSTPLTLALGEGDLSFHLSTHLFQLLPLGLLVYGIFQLHTFQEDASGLLEICGLLLSLIGMLLLGIVDFAQGIMLIFHLQELSLFSLTEGIYPIGYIFWPLGSLIFGIAVLLAARLPRGGAWLCIVGSIIIFVGFNLLFLWGTTTSLLILSLSVSAIFAPWSAGWLWLGLGLRSRIHPQDRQDPQKAVFPQNLVAKDGTHS